MALCWNQGWYRTGTSGWYRSGTGEPPPVVPLWGIRVPPVAIRTPRWGHSGAKMWKCVLCRACPSLSMVFKGVSRNTIFWTLSVISRWNFKSGTYLENVSVSESVISILRFSLVARCPMTLKCQFHFFPLVLLQSRPVGRLGLQVKTKKKRSALQFSAVGIVGISDGLSRFAANAIKISAFPIPRQNIKKYPFLWGWYKIVQCRQKNIVLNMLTLKFVFFILMRKILIKSAKSGEFVKDRPCSSKWRVVTGHQCDVATI